MKPFLPPDPDFESRVRRSFASLGECARAGATLDVLRAGEVHLTAPYDARFAQQDGFLHAGSIATLLDTVCGYAAYSLMPADSRVLSVEFKVNLLSPARGDRFRAEGRVIKPGRTITVCEGKLYSLEGVEETFCALMQATMICVRD